MYRMFALQKITNYTEISPTPTFHHKELPPSVCTHCILYTMNEALMESLVQTTEAF